MSVREAAESMGAKPGALRYPVSKLVEFGLLEGVGSVKLEGHTVEIYRPTAEEFFVPFGLLSYPTRRKMIGHVMTVKEFPAFVFYLPEAQGDLWGVLITVGYSDGGIPFELELMPADLQSVYTREPWKALEAPPNNVFHVFD